MIVASMLLTVLQEVITLYNCGMMIIIILYLVHCFHLLLALICMLFLSIFFIVVGMLLAVLREVVTLNDYEMIIILYSMH